MPQYNHKQPILPPPTTPKKRGGFRKKLVILLLAAALGGTYHKISPWIFGSGSGNSAHNGLYSELTSHGSLYEIFQKYRPQFSSEEPSAKAKKQQPTTTPLIKATADGNEKEVQKLLNTSKKKSHSFIDGRDEKGRTALMVAAYHGQNTICELLITAGANVSLANNSAQTPLHFAAWNNQLKTIPLLLENTADINAIDKSGNTPLMFAVSRGNKEMVALLLNAGANKDIRNKEGQNAVYIAKQKGFDEIANLLKGEQKQQ